MRVLFDITILVRAAKTPEQRSGIPRYMIELLRTFKDPRFNVDVVPGVWSEDVVACECADQRIKKAWHGLFGRLHNRFESRYHLGWLYRAMGRIPVRYRDSGLRARLSGKPEALKKWITRYDQRRLFPGKDLDVFHSPFLELPPRKEMGEIPRVITIHDVLPVLYPDFFRRSARDYVEKALKSIVPSKDTVICVSESTRKDVLSLLAIPDEHCRVIPEAASDHMRPFQDQEELGNALMPWGLEQGAYLLSVATFEPRKNLPFLLRCYSELARDGKLKHWPLVLCGATGWGGAMKEIKRLAGLSNGRVILAGHVSDAQLRALYSGAGLFVYVPHYEGFGLPPLEAMQCGAPVIASNCSALRETVGDAALQISSTDKIALRKSILQVINDGGLRSELRSRGLARAKQFSWEKTAELTAQAYRDAIQNNE